MKNTKIFTIIMFLIVCTLKSTFSFSQSTTQEDKAFINLVKRMYNSSPVDGGKVVDRNGVKTCVVIVSLLKETPNIVIVANAKAREMAELSFGEPCDKFEPILTLDDATTLKQVFIFTCVKKSALQDEYDWNTAIKTNTIDSYEEYLSGVSDKKHELEAINLVKKALVSKGEQKGRENNISEMEIYLNKYIDGYPTGEDIEKVKLLLCNKYVEVADELVTESKTDKNLAASKIDDALIYYDKSLRFCKDAQSINLKVLECNKLKLDIEKRLKKENRPNYGYFAYLYDPNIYGFSWGAIKNKNTGMYISLSANPEIFKNTDEVSGINILDDGRFIKKIAAAEGILGITHKITYPVWFYLGGGARYCKELFKLDEPDANWISNKDKTKIKPIVDFGLIAKLWKLSIISGVKLYEFKTINYTIGLGFTY